MFSMCIRCCTDGLRILQSLTRTLNQNVQSRPTQPHTQINKKIYCSFIPTPILFPINLNVGSSKFGSTKVCQPFYLFIYFIYLAQTHRGRGDCNFTSICWFYGIFMLNFLFCFTKYSDSKEIPLHFLIYLHWTLAQKWNRLFWHDKEHNSQRWL